MVFVVTLSVLGWTTTGSATRSGTQPARTPDCVPGPDLNLRLAAPITTWDEAVPLGNGLLGGLFWGEGRTLRLSLDRGDLWDERPADGVRWTDFNYASRDRGIGRRGAHPRQRRRTRGPLEPPGRAEDGAGLRSAPQRRGERRSLDADCRREDAMIHIDEPRDTMARHAFLPLQGWQAADARPASIEAWLNDRPIRVSIYPRPDVEALHPGKAVSGFSAIVDLSTLPVGSSKATISIAADGKSSHVLLTIAPETWAAIDQMRAARDRKRAWLREHLQCPACGSPLAVGEAQSTITCGGCGVQYEQHTRAFNLIPPAEAQHYDIETPGNISSHGYDETVRAILAEVDRTGGKVLDCGAGLRQEATDLVVNTEIADYPSTDVVAVNHSLPFQDGVFDAVLSLHVLEHVKDPFQSARELARVLKPGGRLLCVVPLLAPEHGFPFHFFNMTRSGLAHLFKDLLTVERMFVPASGAPINALQWILTVYQNYLPERTKGRFRRMRVKNIVDRPLPAWLDDDIVTRLAEYGRWTLATNISAVMVKPAEGGK
jgi:SAM-dependent methyltransferase